MFQRSPSALVQPLVAAFIGLALAVCSGPAQSQNVDDIDMPETPKRYTAVVNSTLNMYTALEHCDVGADRLQKFKQRMMAKATTQMGVTAAQFNAAFEAGLPAAREEVDAHATAKPAETKKFCETERAGF